MAGADSLRVAAVQAAPVLLDTAATLEKAVALIDEAAAAGARLIAFGEGFLPGHPIWLHVHPVTSPAQIGFASRLVEAAITIPGPETDRLASVARRTGTMVVMGVVERLSRGSSQLALAALVVGPDGVVASRRKLVPAVGERVMFTPGDGDAIRVFDSPWGPVSVLLGGENSNPLLTWTLRELGARLHVAAWPPHFNKPGVMGETASITGRAIAYQNSAHVISVAGATSEATRAEVAGTPVDRALLDRMAADPGSSVWAPRGALLAGPLAGGDGILHADLDLSAGGWASLVNRHYDRPDLFRVTIDRSRRPPPLAFREGWPAAGAEAPPPFASLAGDHVPGAGERLDVPPSVGAAPDPASGGPEGRARRLIADRFGSQLEPADAEGLVPFVVGVLKTSADLAALESAGELDQGARDPGPPGTQPGDDARS